jgi:hypothetical protein
MICRVTTDEVRSGSLTNISFSFGIFGGRISPDVSSGLV